MMHQVNAAKTLLIAAPVFMTMAACVAVPANAQIVLSPATVSQFAGSQVTGAPRTNGTTVNNFGSVVDSTLPAAGYPYQGQGFATGTAAAIPSPSISATASFSAAALPNAYVDPVTGTSSGFAAGGNYNGSIQYWMEVLGPTPTVAVTIGAKSLFQASALSSNTGVVGFLNFGVRSYSNNDGYGPLVVSDTTTFNASVDISGSIIGYRYSPDISGNAASGFSGGFNENGTYNFSTGTPYSVSLQDIISISGFGANYSSSGSISGMIDPIFLIARSVPNAGDYTFVFSPGIGNAQVAALPAPASWAMMIFGFSMIGGVMRYRVNLGRRSAGIGPNNFRYG